MSTFARPHPPYTYFLGKMYSIDQGTKRYFAPESLEVVYIVYVCIGVRWHLSAIKA